MLPVTPAKPIALAASDVAALRVSVFVRPAISEKTGIAIGKSVWKIFGIPESVDAINRTPTSFIFLKLFRKIST